MAAGSVPRNQSDTHPGSDKTTPPVEALLRSVRDVYKTIREIVRVLGREPRGDGQDVRDAAAAQTFPVVRGADGAELYGAS
jgi:hypothetical protein